MVGPEDLPNAVALNSSLGTLARVLGPALGGTVVAGAGVSFAVNSASFVAELAALFALDTAALHRPARDVHARILSGTREALRFVFEDQVLGHGFTGAV